MEYKFEVDLTVWNDLWISIYSGEQEKIEEGVSDSLVVFSDSDYSPYLWNVRKRPYSDLLQSLDM